MQPKLEETITIDFITSSPSTGAAVDADSTPSCEVFEDANDTAILSPSVVKRTGKTGDYRITIPCTVANGFEAGKSYNAIVSATVATIVAKSVARTFQVRGCSVDDIAASFVGINSKLDAIDGYIDTEVGAIKTKTDQLVFTAGKLDANAAVSASDMSAIAKEILKYDWTQVSGEASESVLNALRSSRNRWAISVGGMLTVYKEDGTTVAWTRAVQSDAGAIPVIGMS